MRLLNLLSMLLLVACQVSSQDDGYSEAGEFDNSNSGNAAEGEDADASRGPSQPAASILMHRQELADDGTFKYAFSADNGLQQKEAFHPDGSRTGAYSYVDPRGETVLVRYRADRYGFHVLDGSSIPTTPPLAGRPPSQEDEGSETSPNAGVPENSSYEVEESEGDSPSAFSNSRPPQKASAPRLFGFEMTRAPNLPGLHNRFYRSAAQELFSEAIVADQRDLDSVAAEDVRDDLNGASSSHRPYNLAASGYVPVRQGLSQPSGKSPFAALARQIHYPTSGHIPYPTSANAKRGRAEALVEEIQYPRGRAEALVEDIQYPTSADTKRGRAEGLVEDSSPEHAETVDNGDYRLHVGKYDDGSYQHHAGKYDDGSYPQHAEKYDDGSYHKYARMYGEGQYGDGGDAGRGENEAESVRQPAEAEVSYDY